MYDVLLVDCCSQNVKRKGGTVWSYTCRCPSYLQGTHKSHIFLTTTTQSLSLSLLQTKIDRTYSVHMSTVGIGDVGSSIDGDDEQQREAAAAHPPFAVRIPASVLERDDVLELIVPNEHFPGHGQSESPSPSKQLHLVVAQPPKDAESSAEATETITETLPIQWEHGVGRSHVFMGSTPDTSNLTKKTKLKEKDYSWKFVNSSKTDTTLLIGNNIPDHHDTIDKSNDTQGQQTKANVPTLQELGNKARNRLQQERSNRREIVQLTDDDGNAPMISALPSVARAKRRMLESSSSFGKATAAVHKKAPKVKKRRKSPRGKKIDMNQPDQLPPNVAHIQAATSSLLPKERSRFVQLHGLPRSSRCTVEKIKAFFTGLQSPTILLVLSNQVAIPCLDAVIDEEQVALRFLPTELRVLAQFASAPTALLAADRSGETITYLNSDNEEKKQIPIAVTSLSKDVATQLFRVVSYIGEKANDASFLSYCSFPLPTLCS